MRICWKTSATASAVGILIVLQAFAQSDSIVQPVPIPPHTTLPVAVTESTAPTAAEPAIIVRVWDVSFSRSRPLRQALRQQLDCTRVDVVRYRNRCLEFRVWTDSAAGLLAEDVQGIEVAGGWLRVNRVEKDTIDSVVYLRPWHDPRR